MENFAGPWLLTAGQEGPHSGDGDAAPSSQVAKALQRRMMRMFMFGHMVFATRVAALLPAWLRDRLLCKKFGLHESYDEVAKTAAGKKAA